jgi:maltooligosyltrehalose trehalohydrolase
MNQAVCSFRHEMPFGAQVLADGRVRFRLWAPAVRQVGLCLESADGERIEPMVPQGSGWHELTTSRAAAGTRYRFDVGKDRRVPDPASRWQPDDVHGASEVVDPSAYRWRTADWQGRPWEEAVIYELHVGAFSAEGTFRGAIPRLDDLAALGVTAIELMPVADFPGARNWGYDGVLPFAPDSRYGRPEDLKALVDAAHARDMMVLLDVVYNHFGPEGNYLHLYAPDFFTDRHRTPWGAAIDFDGPNARPVRDFFRHNALYWIEEYRMDGLRLDAVHAIADNSQPHILLEIAQAVRSGPGLNRHVHLVLENDRNEARYLRRDGRGRAVYYDAQWNDDLHHAFHVLLTRECDGYYADYAPDATRLLGRSLAEGFAYQGEISPYRDDSPRGEPSGELPPTAFVHFLQNHDQVGNRAFGERLTAQVPAPALRAATVAWLLSPGVPMLFMGEEFGAATPFLFFCDFGGALAAAVTEGRRREFARFRRFSAPEARERIPDPNDPAAFERSRLDWECRAHAPHREWLALYRRLLRLRRERLVPRLAGMKAGRGSYEVLAEGALAVRWRLSAETRLCLLLNLSGNACAVSEPPPQALLCCEPPSAETALRSGRLDAYTAACWIDEAAGAPS